MFLISPFSVSVVLLQPLCNALTRHTVMNVYESVFNEMHILSAFPRAVNQNTDNLWRCKALQGF